MKKKLKIITVNLLLLIILFFIADIFCFVKEVRHHGRLHVFNSPLTFTQYYLRTYKRFFYTNKNYDYYFLSNNKFFRFREPMNTKSEREPVLVMGCSFAYGNDLKDEQTLAGKLVKYTNRPVYNRAIYARGLAEMLYQLRSDKFYEDVPKPEWFVYVFIPDQIRRTQTPCSVVDIGVFYDKNLNIKHDLSFPLFHTIKDKYFNMYEQKYIDFSILLLKEIKAETVKHRGEGIKYVFLYYDNDNVIFENMKPKLEEEGFKVFSVRDLTEKNLFTPEYKAADGVHPSESAWEVLAPAIVEKTGM